MLYSRNLNDNLLVAVTARTSGPCLRENDLIEICVLVLDHLKKPSRQHRPFYCQIKPKKPNNYDTKYMKLSKIDYFNLVERGLDPYDALDLFEQWFGKLGLGKDKKLAILTHNWGVASGFIENWLGRLTFDHIFHNEVRDLKAIALFENDKADHQAARYPYPKVYLQYLATTVQIERTRPYTLLNDCVIIAEIYQRFLRHGGFAVEVKEGEAKEEMEHSLIG